MIQPGWMSGRSTGTGATVAGMTQDGKNARNEYEGPTDLKYKQMPPRVRFN